MDDRNIDGCSRDNRERNRSKEWVCKVLDTYFVFMGLTIGTLLWNYMGDDGLRRNSMEQIVNEVYRQEGK